MDFNWIDVLVRGHEHKKAKSQRQENKTVSKRIKRQTVSKSLGQHRNVYLFSRSR